MLENIPYIFFCLYAQNYRERDNKIEGNCKKYFIKIFIIFFWNFKKLDYFRYKIVFLYLTNRLSFALVNHLSIVEPHFGLFFHKGSLLRETRS